MARRGLPYRHSGKEDEAMRALQTLQAIAGPKGRRLGVAAAALAVGLLGTAPAFADPPWWHHHRHWGYGPGVVVAAPPPVVYGYAAPAPVYAPPPVYYAPPPPPVAYAAPGVSLGVTIPIR
jgi:hypothetical protein